MANELSETRTTSRSTTTSKVPGLNAFSALRLYSDFRLVWVGNFFALASQWIQILTIGWLVLKLTDGNALATGTVIGIRTLPVLVVGPWAGVLADRVDRRKLV
ncbi:MAG: MFS transporter, partial [Dehalococcoidia bacterium]